MNENDEIHGLFPTPIFSTKLGRDFTEEELEIANNCEMGPNQGNHCGIAGNELENPKLKDIRLFIESKIERVYREIISPKSDTQIYITQSWFNHTRKNQYHHEHSHANSFLSGVLYFSAKEEFDKIVFRRPHQCKQIDVGVLEPNPFNSDTWYFPVSTGKLVIFPSVLAHFVDTVIVDHDTRISLAFNTFIRGKLGSFEHKTGLYLP